MAVIDEPAAARAIDRCLVARSLADKRGPVTRTHPGTCGWCDYPLEQLRQLLEGFNAWAGWDERRRRYERFEVQVWTEHARAHPDQAEAEIVAAQAFVPPLTTGAVPPAGGTPTPGGSIPPALPSAEDRIAATFRVGRVQTSPPDALNDASEPTTPPDADPAHEPIDEELAAWT